VENHRILAAQHIQRSPAWRRRPSRSQHRLPSCNTCRKGQRRHTAEQRCTISCISLKRLLLLPRQHLTAPRLTLTEFTDKQFRDIVGNRQAADVINLQSDATVNKMVDPTLNRAPPKSNARCEMGISVDAAASTPLVGSVTGAGLVPNMFLQFMPFHLLDRRGGAGGVHACERR
jgi:hypothetical protein